MASSRRALVVCGALAMSASLVLPAITILGTTFSGAALLAEAVARPHPGLVAFSANIVLPVLALRRPRWRRCEVLVVTAVLAIAAWLTARAVAGPVQLHAGVAVWWVAMMAFAVVALQARASE